MSYKSNRFRISAPTRIDKFELLDRSFFAFYIYDCFEYIIKNQKQ